MNIPYLSEFLTLAALHLGVVMWPGPNLTLVAKNSVTLQLRFALYCTLGIALGTVAHVCLALFGLSSLIAASPIAYAILQFVGAGYLIYVGTKACRSKPYRLEEELTGTQKTHTACSALKEGFTNQMLNPKAYFFFFALFTQIVGATPVAVKALYGVWMTIVTFLWFAFVTVTLANPLVKTRFSSNLHYVARVFGLLLIGFGVRILISPFL